MSDAAAGSAAYWIRHLDLAPHPEGGFYRQTYCADLTIGRSALPAAYAGDRSACTAIFFLLEGNAFSAFHRIASDEMWHFYTGSALSVHVIDKQGEHQEIRLGSDPHRGESFQAIVSGGQWFGSCLAQSQGFALVGCTVSPGFDFADFEMADRNDLIEQYPQHRQLITRLTRSNR